MEQRSNISFSGNAKITGLPAASATGEPATYEQATLLAGTQTVTGAKTFSSPISTSTGTSESINATRSSAGKIIAYTDGTDSLGIYNRAGTPESNITDNIGSLSLDSANGRVYVKSTDSASTGWYELGQLSQTTYNATSLANGGSYVMTHPSDSSNTRIIHASRSSASTSGSILLHFNGSNGSTTFTDTSGNGATWTGNGGVSIDTSQSVFGGSSIFFDGSNDYINTTAWNTAYQIGTGDFTFDFWIRYSSFANWRTIYEDTGSSGGILVQATTGTGALGLYLDNGGSYSAIVAETGSRTANTWYHYRITRSGTSVVMARDGVSVASATSSANFSCASGSAKIGTSVAEANYYMHGYIDEFYMIAGTALTQSGFSVPTAEWSDAGSTVDACPLCFSGGTGVQASFTSATSTTFYNRTGATADLQFNVTTKR